MLDLIQELRNYPAMDINILAKDVDGIPDDIRNSIVLYNKALGNLRMNSEDIAIIELKRAVAMNPNFYEAMNLLGICYTYIKDYAKAAEMFEKVASHESNGVKAMEYLNSLQGQNRIDTMREKRKNTRPEAIKKELHPNLPGLDSAKIKTEKSIAKYLGCFAAGILIALFITGILNHDGKDVKTSSVIEPAPNTIPQSKYEQLDENNKKLDSDLKAVLADLDYQKNVNKLLDAQNLAQAGDYLTAGDQLVLLKTIQFKDNEKSKFEKIYHEVMPKSAWAAYTQGSSQFTEKKYKESLDSFSKLLTYGNEWAYIDVTLYKIGICYKELKDVKNAADTFQKLRETYPNSQYTVYAGYRLGELNGQP